jgi:hypothetical protein
MIFGASDVCNNRGILAGGGSAAWRAKRGCSSGPTRLRVNRVRGQARQFGAADQAAGLRFFFS